MKLFSINKSRQYALFFWLSFIIVLFLNVLVWLYLNQVEAQFKDELKARLLNTNQLLSRLLIEYNENVDINLLMPDNKSSIEYLYYQQPIEDIRLHSKLQSILLVSPHGEILISSPEILSEQNITSMAGNPYFKRALTGEIVVSKLEEFAGEKFMTAYAPIHDLNGFTTGILVIEAKAEFFNVVNNLKNRLLLFSFINFILILLIAFILSKTIKRTISYQTEIKDKEHLVQLGTMAAIVAHELRNPLSIIEGTNDIIKMKYCKNDDEIFEFIPKEINRLAVLIEDFLNFAREPQLTVEKLDVSTLLGYIKMSLSENEADRLQIEPLSSEVEIYTDQNLLKQALLNIVKNAMQATEQGGNVSIKIVKQKKQLYKIVVKDNGQGIPAEILPKIFEPFFTSKQRGTGLGLAITKRVIEQLKGRIAINSVANESTEVIIDLPSLDKNKELRS